MISIVAKFIVNEGEESNFLTKIDGLIKASQAEEGCIEYLLHKDSQKPLTYCLIEKWKDQEAVDIHNNTPHFTTTVPTLVELAKIEVDVYTAL
ncbi:MAG: antibiotic biosynthesis monooxygenase [Bacteroidetes bacterium]|nr:antibiotic biosynthesis monooxygenase [Bacteroidota bacterium]